MKKKAFVFLFSLFALINLYSQTDELDILKSKAASQKTADSYMSVADYYFTYNLPKDEIFHAYHDSAFIAAKKEKSDEVLGRYYYRKAWLYNSQQQDSISTLRKYLKESLVYFEKAGQYHRHTQAYMKIGVSLFYSNQPDSALTYLQMAIDEKYIKEVNAPQYEIYKNIYFFIISIYRFWGDYPSVLTYYHKIIELAEKNNDIPYSAQNQMFMADIYKEINEHEESYKYYINAGNLYEKIEDYFMAANCYMFAGGQLTIYLDRQNEAIKILEKALEFSNKVDDKDLEAQIWQLTGHPYEKMNIYDKAIDCYRKAETLFDEIGDLEKSNVIKHMIMLTFKEAGQVDSARINLHKTQTIGDVLLYDTMFYPKGGADELSLKLTHANNVATMNKEKYDILNEQYYEKEVTSLRMKILFISISAILIIVALLLLYARQRQKIKAGKLARYAEEKEHEYAVLQTETEMRLVRKYIDGLESERERLSKELHDGICNDLLALEMKLKNVMGNKQELEEHLSFLNKTRENIRHVSHELMPPAFQCTEIDEMLSDYVSHIDKPENMIIKYYSDQNTDWNTIPKEIAYEAYRITQEALANSIKHSSAKQIDVKLTKNDNQFIIEVLDNGKGFDKSQQVKGIGIRTIYERAKSMEAILNIDSSTDGTSVKVIFKI